MKSRFIVRRTHLFLKRGAVATREIAWMTTTLRLVTLAKLLIDGLTWNEAIEAVIRSIISLAHSRTRGSSSRSMQAQGAPAHFDPRGPRICVRNDRSCG